MPENPAKPPAGEAGQPPGVRKTAPEPPPENFAQILTAAAEEVSPRPQGSIPEVAFGKAFTGILGVWYDRTLYNLAEKPEKIPQKTAQEIFYNYGTTPEQLKAVQAQLEEDKPVSTPAGDLSATEDIQGLVQQSTDILQSFREQHPNLTRFYSGYHGKAFPSKGVQGRISKGAKRLRRVVTKPARWGLRKLAKTGLGQAVKKGAAWLATRIGLAAIGGPIGAAIAVAWIALDVIKAVAKRILRDPVKALVIVGGVALAAVLAPLPFLLQLVLLAPAAILALGAAASILGTLGGLGGAAFGFAAGFIITLLSAVAAPLVSLLMAAVIITAVVVFVLVAWFMHASTAARFLVGGAVPSFEAVDFDVTKSVAPKMDFENSELPVTLTYTISVVPLEGARLLNVSVEETTTVLREADAPTIPSRSWSIASLDTAWTQTYNQTLDARFSDSLVGDTVTVTADVEGGPTREQESTSLTVLVGSPPQDCPSGWPTAHGDIRQGPEGTYSHAGQEALDIGVGGRDGVIPARATHKGRVETFPNLGGWGNVVDIIGLCLLEEGRVVDIRTRYAHLFSIGVKNGNLVNWGDEIGRVGNTGASTGVHLHYEFRRNLTITPFYIPRSVPYGCFGFEDCGAIRW